MLQIDLGYPPLEIEKSLAIHRTSKNPVEKLKTVISLDELLALREFVDQIKIEESISEYILQIVSATRDHPQLRLGVSTRGTLLYARICRTLALFNGRDYVIPEDVKQLAEPVLSHRILLNTKSQYDGSSAAHIIQEIVHQEKVPR